LSAVTRGMTVINSPLGASTTCTSSPLNDSSPCVASSPLDLLWVIATSPSTTSQLFPLQVQRPLSVWHLLQRRSCGVVMHVGFVFRVKHQSHCKRLC
jgi:hypothetical protein